MREATVNAAKHSGARDISVYLEAGATALDIFVRDRGKGFKPGAIPEDRYGVRESVIGRMQRHGGEATAENMQPHGLRVVLRLT